MHGKLISVAKASLVCVLADAALAEECDLTKSEVLRDVSKACTADVVQVECGARLDSLDRVGEASCCNLASGASAVWRCGDEDEASLSCATGSREVLAIRGETALRVLCLAIKAAPKPDPEPDPDTDGDGNATDPLGDAPSTDS